MCDVQYGWGMSSKYKIGATYYYRKCSFGTGL